MGEAIPFPTQNIPQAANDNVVPKSEMEVYFEKQIQKPNIKAQLKTTVSRFAIILPGIFMKPEDATKMVKMLDETRSEIVETQSLKPLIEKVQAEAANDNQAPVYQTGKAA